jgi:hypothetical protein
MGFGFCGELGAERWVNRGYTVTAKSELQRLKPLGRRAVYFVAKATTHKDSRVAVQSFLYL